MLGMPDKVEFWLDVERTPTGVKVTVPGLPAIRAHGHDMADAENKLRRELTAAVRAHVRMTGKPPRQPDKMHFRGARHRMVITT